MGSLPCIEDEIEYLRKEINRLSELKRSLCEHCNMEHHGFNHDGG